MREWPAETFRVRDALELGYGREVLRSAQLTAPFHGVRMVGPVRDEIDLCRAYATKMPMGAAFSGPTAARLWGMPLPRIVDPRLHVSASYGRPQPRGRGVTGHHHDPETSIVRRDRLRVLAPVDTWCSLATTISMADLVAVADFILTGLPPSRVPPLADPDDLMRAVGRRAHAPGVGDLRDALRLARVGAWSRPESLLRVATARAGLPEPELNVRAGVGIVDLWWPAFDVGVEYDGDHHRGRAQYRADVLRHERMADGGTLLIHVTADDLFGRTAETIERIARRLRSRGWMARASVRIDRIPTLRP
jgi:hypothetical protein